LSSSSRTRPIKQQLQISSRQARETWRRMHFELETKHAGVEGNCRIDIVDDVSDTNFTHGFSP
jgi:hypothetical protein